MIGVTAGIEADAVSPQWLQPSYEQVDKIIVPSAFAKEGFLNAIYKYKEAFDEETKKQIDVLRNRLGEKISVVHYPVKNYDLIDLGIDFETKFNFLLVAQWSPRKNIEDTIRAFLTEFKDNNDVGLVVKTNVARNCTPDKLITEKKLENIKSGFKDLKCKTYLIHGAMTENEIHSLYRHPKIKAMINFGHGEGFGLPLFEAAYCGLPIITHDFGGQKDFLYAPKKDKKRKEKNRAHFSKVLYNIRPVQVEAVWAGVVEPDAEWAYPNFGSCKLAMREVYTNYNMYRGTAKRLKKWVEKNFQKKDKQKEIIEHVYGEKVGSVDLDHIATDDLPKISILTSVYDGDEFIEPFLEDITRQTIFKDKCELILINANSPGNEEKTISKYLEKYPDNIKYKKLNEDPGVYGVWNMAVKMSAGEFLTNANLDDRQSINSLELHAKHLYEDSDVDLVYSDSLITNKPNEKFEDNSSQNRRYNFEEFSKEAMLRGNLPHNHPLWRKTLHDKHGYFDDSLRSAGDWEFWLRCCTAGSKFKKISGVHGLYYFNPKGISTNFENFSWKQEEESKVYTKYKALLNE